MYKSLGEKIRAIREFEGLTRAQFFELTGIPETAQKNYERGITKNIGSNSVMKIIDNPRFKKYTLWLMVDDLASIPEQIAPELRSEDKE